MNTVFVTHDGKTLTYAQWAKKLGITKSAFQVRWCRWRGTPNENKAFIRGHDTTRMVKITHKGKTDTLYGWAKKLGIQMTTFRRRWEAFRGTEREDDAFHKGPLPHYAPSRFVANANGEVHDIRTWARIAGISEASIRNRLHSGYTIDEAIRKNAKFAPGGEWRSLYGGTRLVIDGIEDNIRGHARRNGITINALSKRRKAGWNVVKAVTTPMMSREEVLQKSLEARVAERQRREMAAVGGIV